jgi:nicotinate-nucleotide adenylyltransferase
LKKIGLLGGTFDPVHNGHIEIANSFIRSGIIDELWILLTPFPPHKLNENHVSYETRLMMLEMAFADLDIKILTLEKELPKPSYTYRTIQVLKEEHRDSNFFFCLGEDSLSKFHSWKHFDKILAEADLLVAKRPNSDHSSVKQSILDKTTFVEHKPIEISSSSIKKNIEDAEYLSSNLPTSVHSIIEKENLYR